MGTCYIWMASITLCASWQSKQGRTWFIRNKYTRHTWRTVSMISNSAVRQQLLSFCACFQRRLHEQWWTTPSIIYQRHTLSFTSPSSLKASRVHTMKNLHATVTAMADNTRWKWGACLWCTLLVLPDCTLCPNPKVQRGWREPVARL
jgi:hypothetical protein